MLSELCWFKFVKNIKLTIKIVYQLSRFIYAMHHVPVRALALPYVSLIPSIACLETFSRSSDCSLELIRVDFPPFVRDSVSSSRFRPS